MRMREEVVQRLNALNRRFYEAVARPFAASRGAGEPGLARLLPSVRGRVGDLGCGQGRLALLLPPGCTYVGMDFSPALLALAREAAASAGRAATFVEGDLLAEQWPAPVAAGGFDWLFLRAVLHHIPGAANRAAVVRRAAALLAPGGRLVLANWQFLRSPRLRRRLQPWARVGLSAAEVEPGDYLLDWRREVEALRYVHLVDEAETVALLEGAGLTVEQLYLEDGHTRDLTLYGVGGKSCEA